MKDSTPPAPEKSATPVMVMAVPTVVLFLPGCADPDWEGEESKFDLSWDEGRELYRDLHQIFGGTATIKADP